MSNNHIKYELTNCTVSVNDEDIVTSYGIRCLIEGTFVKEIQDISPNKPAVESFIKEINKLGLPPEYLEDILENSLDDMI